VKLPARPSPLSAGLAELLFPLCDCQHLFVDARQLVGVEQHVGGPTVPDVHLHGLARVSIVAACLLGSCGA
jgi:hypothetical protein